MTETTGNRMILMRATNKPFHIDKRLVYEAYKAVKSNRGAAGGSGANSKLCDTSVGLARFD
jgi:RNA-directed DNA polymerase